MGILIAVIVLILLGMFWRQILAGSLLLLALSAFGIFILAFLLWWSLHDDLPQPKAVPTRQQQELIRPDPVDAGPRQNI
ncbi:MAG TPA: hypothetical protein HPP80_06670 [Rhodospirillaceae bacterium]|nr:hypothetical protein [Rhodospirillaceae bacterium]